MSKNLGKPSLKIWNYSSKKDISWKNELSDFIHSIKFNKKVSCGLNDAYMNMKIIDKCYKDNPFKDDNERIELLFKYYEKMSSEDKLL